MITYKCDRCGKINEDVKEMFRLHVYRLGMGMGKKENYNKEVCKECLKDIRRLIERYEDEK